jgi:transposase-like protein
MRKRRRFTPEFKAQVVLQVLTGVHSPAEVGRKHALSPNLLSSWKATVLQRLPSLFQGDERQEEDQARIAELEQLLGRATRQIEVLKKASMLLDPASTRNGR